jgi:cytochrome c biogenesis protein CcdA
MLASIHPLGERARNNRWGLTVAAHAIGSWAGGVAVFGAAALVGRLTTLPAWPVAIAAAAVEVAVLTGRMRVPGPRRQVNEDWLHRYRGWVYGLGFGLQLGSALATIVTTAATYLALALTAATGSLAAGVVVGTIYGLGRSVPLLSAANVDRPHRLAAFHARLRALARPVQLTTAAGLVLIAAATTGAR